MVAPIREQNQELKAGGETLLHLLLKIGLINYNLKRQIKNKNFLFLLIIPTNLDFSIY